MELCFTPRKLYSGGKNTWHSIGYSVGERANLDALGNQQNPRSLPASNHNCTAEPTRLVTIPTEQENKVETSRFYVRWEMLQCVPTSMEASNVYRVIVEWLDVAVLPPFSAPAQLGPLCSKHSDHGPAFNSVSQNVFPKHAAGVENETWALR